jgi:hypothetical protein
MTTEERFAFTAEWYDAQACLVRQYLVTFFTKDNTVEMFDVKNRRMFLKRSEYAGLGLSQLYKGAILCKDFNTPAWGFRSCTRGRFCVRILGIKERNLIMIIGKDEQKCYCN